VNSIRLFLILVLALPTVVQSSHRPHVLIILADDMGYGDLGCMGSGYLSTPEIE